jgi:hypothetical protein
LKNLVWFYTITWNYLKSFRLRSVWCPQCMCRKFVTGSLRDKDWWRSCHLEYWWLLCQTRRLSPSFVLELDYSALQVKLGVSIHTSLSGINHLAPPTRDSWSKAFQWNIKGNE